MEGVIYSQYYLDMLDEDWMVYICFDFSSYKVQIDHNTWMSRTMLTFRNDVRNNSHELSVISRQNWNNFKTTLV
jgi:hypothetical protein